MKTLIILCLLILCACSKENVDLGPYYNQFIGEWASVNSSEKVLVIVSEKGTIKIEHEIDRGKKIAVKQFKLSDTLELYNSKFVGGNFIAKNEDQISLYLSPGKDSMLCTTVGNNLVNNQLASPYKIQVFQKAN